ncbi:uncharacterized protein LOC102805363 [Saccoglossus kowalevskii]
MFIIVSTDNNDDNRIYKGLGDCDSKVNEELILYFKDLPPEENVSLERVESFLGRGTNVNCTDKYGQTVMHEVASSWHVDVARFLADKGANVDVGDKDGRTPLHVAAATNHHEMVKFLLDKGAKIEHKTYGQQLTPLAIAASYDAVEALGVLYKRGADVNTAGNNGRTPIMVAAMGDRSVTCRYLLNIGAKVDLIDKNGESCIVVMQSKMSQVAKEALNQFHVKNPKNRKQFYYLNQLETRKPGVDAKPGLTPMEVIVENNQLDLITHPVFTKLIEVKWEQFARKGAWKRFLLDLLLILCWTVLALAKPDARGCYDFPGDVWRVILWIIACGYTIILIFEELKEYHSSQQKIKKWQEWKKKIIDDDLEHCDQLEQWPEEKGWLENERGEVDKKSAPYFRDFWNIYDWIVYVLLVIVVVLHLVDIAAVSDELCNPPWQENKTIWDGSTTESPNFEDYASAAAKLHIRLFAFTVIFVWIRLFKPARAFTSLGPFIVMLYNILGDIARFSFLYFVFYIPYVCAFWMMFGGDVDGFETVSETMFSLFRMTLVDEYNYDGLKDEHPVMTDILVGTYLAITAVIFLNLFIALLSETFVRVHDNVKSNALMERAKIIHSLEDKLSENDKQKFYKYIHEKCAPLDEFYDDDEDIPRENEGMNKMTIQIKEQLNQLSERLSRSKHPGDRGSVDVLPSPREQTVYERDNHSELADMKQQLNESTERMQTRMDDMMNILQSLTGSKGGTRDFGSAHESHRGQFSEPNSRIELDVKDSAPHGDDGKADISANVQSSPADTIPLRSMDGNDNGESSA